MSHSAGGLSDTLRNLADPEQAPPPSHAARKRAHTPSAPSRSTSNTLPRRSTRTDPLHALAALFCFLIGLILLVPALWAVAVLGGFQIPFSDAPTARTMAAAMLTCGPLALLLFLGAWWLRRPTP